MVAKSESPVDRWFIPLFIGFQPSFWWCRISQPSTICLLFFPKMGVSPNHPLIDRIFPKKNHPSILGSPIFRKPPDDSPNFIEASSMDPGAAGDSRAHAHRSGRPKQLLDVPDRGAKLRAAVDLGHFPRVTFGISNGNSWDILWVIS